MNECDGLEVEDCVISKDAIFWHPQIFSDGKARHCTFCEVNLMIESNTNIPSIFISSMFNLYSL